MAFGMQGFWCSWALITQIPTVGDFPLGWKGCTFNVTTLSQSSTKGEHGTSSWTSVNSSSVLQEFNLPGYEVWYKLTNALKEANRSVSTIKMQQPTTSNFMIEKEGMIYFYQSTRCHNPYHSSLYRQLWEPQISFKG
jgi:Flp pilus assembly protein TadG